MPIDSLSWMAGYLEGEGSFLPTPPSAQNWPRVRLQTTDHDIAKFVADQFGTSVIALDARHENWSPTFDAVVTGQNAITWMEELYPFMGQRRREQIVRAIDFTPAEHDKTLNIVEWMAGLFEAEASFMKGPPSNPNKIRIQMQMRDRDVVAKVCDYFGVVVRGPYQPTNPNASPYYAFLQRGKKAADFMTQIRPMMSARRKAQIDTALASYEHHPQKGETHSQAKLTEDNVRFIKRELRKGERTQRSLAQQFGVDGKIITRIKQGKSWVHVTIDD